MGLIYADVTIDNLLRPDVPPVATPTSADSGAVLSCVPESLAVQLDLDNASRRPIVMADGHTREVP